MERVIDLVWVKFLNLVEFDESPLVSVALFGKIFAALVSDKPLALSKLLFLPISFDFLITLFSGYRIVTEFALITVIFHRNVRGCRMISTLFNRLVIHVLETIVLRSPRI